MQKDAAMQMSLQHPAHLWSLSLVPVPVMQQTCIVITGSLVARRGHPSLCLHYHR
jgi:hypothetical protein